jgi:Fe-S cluster biosynthesis and repair protein YggX
VSAENDFSVTEVFETLVVDSDLDRLEALTAGFNIFEAIGSIRSELRHSDFLSFLLNPAESHGLNTKFTKALLFDLVSKNRGQCNLSAIDIDLLELAQLEVRREWENIDILLLSEKEKFVCAIENKIGTKEHSNQLSRYQGIITNHFGDFKKLFIYLTVEGDTPLDDSDWLTYSYTDIYKLLVTLLDESKGSVGDDVFTLMKHYAEMLDRHIMTENEIAELSKKIYQRHKKALDIIFEHKPDMLTETNEHIVQIIERYKELPVNFDHCTKSYIRFYIPQWDEVPAQKSGNGKWTPSGRVLLFEVLNSMNEISMKLVIGPGDPIFRETVFNATENIKVFKGRSNKLYGNWTQVFKKKLVNKEKMNYELESVKNIIDQELEKFFYFGDFDSLVKEVDKILAL